jgi:hypothetical protein
MSVMENMVGSVLIMSTCLPVILKSLGVSQGLRLASRLISQHWLYQWLWRWSNSSGSMGSCDRESQCKTVLWRTFADLRQFPTMCPKLGRQWNSSVFSNVSLLQKLDHLGLSHLHFLDNVVIPSGTEQHLQSILFLSLCFHPVFYNDHT